MPKTKVLNEITPGNLPFQVQENLLLVKQVLEEKTAGGIFVTQDNPKVKQVVKGIVIGVGLGRTLECGKRQEVLVKNGDIIFYSIQAKIDLGQDLRLFLSLRGYPDGDIQDLTMLNMQNVFLRVLDNA